MPKLFLKIDGVHIETYTESSFETDDKELEPRRE